MPEMDAGGRLFQGLSSQQQARAIIYHEGLGLGSLGLITDVLRSSKPEEQKMAEDWEHIFLIRYQGVLWALGYSQQERATIYQRLEALRAAGRYADEF